MKINRAGFPQQEKPAQSAVTLFAGHYSALRYSVLHFSALHYVIQHILTLII